MTNNILNFWQAQGGDDPLDPFFVSAPVLMHSINREGRLLRVSRFWADKLGYEISEMVGKLSTDFLTADSRAYAANVVLPEFFKTGRIHNVDYEFVRKDGKTLPVLMSAIGEYDSQGQFVRSLAIMFDNSEAKRIAAELRQKQRLEAMGALIGDVAHEFNNILAIVEGNLEFLEQGPSSEEREDFIASALKATQRGSDQVQQLLSFGRRAQLTPSLVDISTVAQMSDRMVRRLLPSNITLETVTADDLWKTRVDTGRLETAILNIVNNARDAMPEGGDLRIETGNLRVTDEHVGRPENDLAPGCYVMLAISDTGCGMDNTTLEKIFEPFFTTKEIGKGSGLGLSMVFGFARQSDGAVRAESTPGQGSTFRLYFPAAESLNERALADVPGAPVEDKVWTVFLAEDDDAVRRLLARRLREMGHFVVECGSGDEALRQIENGVSPDLLVTDIVMPGSLQGPELAIRLRRIVPELRVLFVSGYPSEALIHGGSDALYDKVILKPVKARDLINAVDRLIPRKLDAQD